MATTCSPELHLGYKYYYLATSSSRRENFYLGREAGVAGVFAGQEDVELVETAGVGSSCRPHIGKRVEHQLKMIIKCTQ